MGLDSVELVMVIEEEFNIEIPDDIAAKLDTAGKLYEYVLENYNIVQFETKRKDYETEVWDKVKMVIIYQLGAKPEQVKKETNFVYDLGMD